MGVQYNPCAIAQYGLGLCSKYLKNKEEKYLSKMKIQADWLYKNMIVNDIGIGRLEYTFSGDEYNQISQDNYISAIAQGQAISFMLRAALILGEKNYEKMCIRDRNWIAPLGENVNQFEKEICQVTGAKDAAALSAGRCV